MYGWVILNAFLVFIAFVGGLITVASLVTGIVKRNRSLLDLGLKALMVTVVATGIYFMLKYMFLKEMVQHVKTSLNAIK